MNHFFKCIFSSIKNFENRFWMPKQSSLTLALEKISKLEKHVTLLQLGANDGVSSDPYFNLIEKYNWKGILVEPQPIVYERLLRNYKERDHSLIFQNIAVAEEYGFKKMYYLDLPDHTWSDGLTSFDKENIITHINNGYVGEQLSKSGVDISKEDQLKLIKEIFIECKTVDEIFEMSKLQNLTILAMDLEGYDYVIINSLDFDKIRPKMIVYESKFIDFEYYKKTIKYLIKNNYTVFKDGQDIFALTNV